MNTTRIEFIAWLKKADIPYMIDQNEMSIKDFSSIGEAIEYWEEGSNLMQRTALRSINDEPIYNHMIVKVGSIHYSSEHYIVDMFDYNLMAKLSRLHLEIVGNRFRNPELLELCK